MNAASAPLILAVPAKGRLQQNAESFFARAGLELVKPRGARDYRGAIAGFDGGEVAYLSAAAITQQLAGRIGLFRGERARSHPRGVRLGDAQHKTNRRGAQSCPCRRRSGNRVA